MRIDKQFFILCAALLFTSPAFSAAVYDFQGPITHFYSINKPLYISQEKLDYYAQNGISIDKDINISISLDDKRLGTKTDQDGTVIYLPLYSTAGSLTSSTHAYRYAEIASSSIPTNFMNDSSILDSYVTIDNYYLEATNWSFNSPLSSYSGSISVGPRVFIGIGKAHGDTSAFVSNWQIGDSIPFSLTLEQTNLSLSARGELTLIDKTGDTLSTVIPLPPASLLFLTGLLGLGYFGRKKKIKQAGSVVASKSRAQAFALF